jgi:hypothetical protein
MNEDYGPNLRGDSPETAAGDFRSLLAASGGIQSGGGADPDYLGQLRGLEAWAASRGELAGGEWLNTAQLGGAEHYIQHRKEAGRLIKITLPGQFGLRVRIALPPGKLPARLGDAIALRPATPLTYLDRLALHNRLFGDDVEFLGMVRRKGGFSFVTSQIFLHGEKPTVAQIAAMMAGHGFRKLGDANAYYRAEDHLAVFDAHTRNFVLTDGLPVPFDVIPQTVSGRMEALLALWV